MSAVAIVAALAAALAVERRISIAIFHATYDDGPDALAAALSAGRAAGLDAYRSVAPRQPTHDELVLLDAAITAAITVHRAADPAVDPGGAL